MLGVFEFITISDFVTSQIKTIALNFSFSLAFFSLSLNFFKKSPYWKERKKNRIMALFAFLALQFDAVVKWSCCVANKEKKDNVSL